MKNITFHINNRTRLTNQFRRSLCFSLPQAKLMSKQGSKTLQWSKRILSFMPQEHDRPRGDFIGPEEKHSYKYKFGPGFFRIAPDPIVTETGPVKVRDKTPVWTQSPSPFLQAPVPGSSPGDHAPAATLGKTGFFPQTERKPKPTLRNTSSPEVSKSKLSLSNGVEPSIPPPRALPSPL